MLVKYRPVLKMLKITLIIILLGAGGILAYLQHPLFGKLPKGERLAQFSTSPHYIEGAFQNLIDTPMLTTEQSELALMWDNFVSKKTGTPIPLSAIPALKTDLMALDSEQDLVIWLGHSSYYVQLSGQRILIDPVFSSYAAPVPWAVRAFADTNLYHAQDMPEIDLLLITHDHYDHLDYPTVKALQAKVKQVITPLGVGEHFIAWGYDASKVQETDWYQTTDYSSSLHIVTTPARHFSGRTFKRNQSLWAGFALLSTQRRIFFSGDTGYAPHFAEIGEKYGPFDWVTLDSGQYDRRWAFVHMNPEQAAQAADELGTKAFTPAHVGRFSISAHDWDDPFKRISVASQNYDYQLWTPQIGEPLYLDGREQYFTAWWENVQSH